MRFTIHCVHCMCVLYIEGKLRVDYITLYDKMLIYIYLIQWHFVLGVKNMMFSLDNIPSSITHNSICL